MGLDFTGEIPQKTQENSEPKKVNFTPNIAGAISPVEVQKDEQNERINSDSKKEKKPENPPSTKTEEISKKIKAAALGYQENKTNPENSSTTQLAEKLKDIPDNALKTLAEILNNLDELLKDNKTRVAIIIALIPLITTACGGQLDTSHGVFMDQNTAGAIATQQAAQEGLSIPATENFDTDKSFNPNEINTSGEVADTPYNNENRVVLNEYQQTFLPGDKLEDLIETAVQLRGENVRETDLIITIINQEGKKIVDHKPYLNIIMGATDYDPNNVEGCKLIVEFPSN